MPEGLTFIDIVAVVAIGFGLVRGFSNGIIKEVAGLIGVVLGVWAGFRLSFLFAEYYAENTELPENIIPMLAFLTAFVLALVVVLFAGKMLRFILEKTNLSLFDKAAGAAFGGLKWAFLVGSLISLIGKAHLIPEQTKEESISYPILTTYCEGVTEYSIGLIPAAKNVFKDMDNYFDGLDSTRTGGMPPELQPDPVDDPDN